MSDTQELTAYDQMSAEELASILRADFEAADGSGLDDEALLYVMQLYADRQLTKPMKNAREAYTAFTKDYLPCIDDIELSDQESDSMIAVKKRQAKLRNRRVVAATAAVLALVLGFSMGVNSRHTATWEPMYRHSRDYLIVSGNYGHEPTGKVPTLARQWFPEWLPDGYERVLERWNDGEYKLHYRRGESWGDDTLNISFNALSAGETIKFYKSPMPVTQRKHDGVVFYLYRNLQRNCAVGCLNGVVIFVEGKISREVLLQIIESMPLTA